ncbi:MAG: phytoene desaturase [Acidobacteria bacterium]|nr:MAG: phytoene desaturase [Acidobacteriota bacterium]REK12213.1 MAG: phytoene desaturase [Acidobacteriota bacterium]
MQQRTPEVVIVGAGPGGLAASMLLASAGARVTLLERRQRVGGRTSTVEAPGGFRFDLGPTFFLYPQILREIFAACGRSLDDEVELLRLDPHYRLAFEGRADLRLGSSVEQVRREIARLCPADADGFESFLNDNRAKFEAFKPILQRPFNGLRDVLDLPLLQLLPLIRPLRSVERDLRRHFSDPRVRLAFSFQSKYLGMSPFQCPSLFTILSFLEYEYGVYHPVGGCGAVSEAMAGVARDLGVDVRLDEEVRGIEFEGRRAVAVATRRGRIPCDALIVNADFAAAMKRLVPDGLRRRWNDRQLDRKSYSCSTYMLYLGLDGEQGPPDHHTIFLAEDYEGNLADIEQHHRLSETPSFYVQNATRTDRTMAAKGRTSLYVLAPVSHQHPNIDWRREAPSFRARLLRQLEAVGVEDVERRIRFEKQITPADWEADHRIHLGATFNLSHSLRQSLHLRPRNRFEDLDGVYLVGGGTHPGSGLPVIYESARIASRLAAEDLGLEATWKPAAARLDDERLVRTVRSFAADGAMRFPSAAGRRVASAPESVGGDLREEEVA